MTASSVIREWRERPVKFVRDMFKVDPDEWQKDALESLGGPLTTRRRLAMRACTGPGKSAVLAWIGWHRLSCFASQGEHPKGAALSGEGRDNLSDNLWAELSKWRERSEFLKAAFTWNKERIYANDHPSTWFLSARSYAKDANEDAIGTSLSGLHSKFPFVLLDETGNMPVIVGKKASQIFTGNPTDALIASAGNPTSTAGLLYFICTTERGITHVITITADPDDPKRTPRVDIEHAREQIRLHGRDNPWVMATILGEFPPQGFNQLLSLEDVEAAMKLNYKEPDFIKIQKRLGVDVAREGDDRTVLFPRQGLVAFPPQVMRNADGPQIAARVALIRKEQDIEVEYFDTTGGHGWSAFDHLKATGHTPIPVNFSGEADEKTFYNKRAEMWWRMADWVKRGGSIPPGLTEIVPELTSATYTHKNGRFILEPKENIKTKIGRSPDCFVAGTQIATSNGPRAIESLQVGDLVTTPMGATRIIKLWTSDTNALTFARFSDGSELKGKPKHEIFTWNRGWVQLCDLCSTDEVEAGSRLNNIKWKILRKLFTRANHSSFRVQAATINQAEKTCRNDFFIVGFGPSILALFPKGFISTIEMAIGRITPSQIWSVSRRRIICARIRSAEWLTRSLGLRQLMPWTRIEIRPQNGIEAQREDLGIPSTANGHGKKEKARSVVVSGVGKSFQLSPGAPTSAPSRADKKEISKNIASKLFARFVGLRSCVTSIGNKSVAPISVRTEDVPATKVFNLTLETENVYYANGILVSNCADALCLTFANLDIPSAHAHGIFGASKQGTYDYEPTLG